MISVIVLDGGTSNEREISLRSGSAVTSALKAKGYKTEEIDYKDNLSTLTTKLKNADVVFPVLHGQGGEDGKLQKALEDQGINYIGSDSNASELCFNKYKYAQLLNNYDLRSPITEIVNWSKFQNSKLISKPFVIKPNTGGSSIDTFIVKDPSNYNLSEIKAAFKRQPEMLLQNLIEGAEITAGVVDDIALPIIEIIPPENQVFDYTNKYNGATQELCPPLHVDADVQAEAQQLALKVHKLTGCRDMSRTDMIVSENNDLFILETNTIPGFSAQSLLPKAAKEAGMDMPELIDLLVKTALKRK